LQVEGTVHRYGRDINTDVIIPARYLNVSDASALAAHCLEDLDASFTAQVHAGDIIVAEENFGCGSSREHAPIAIKAAGVSLVVAKSFARIFYRNAIDIGLAIVICPPAVDEAKSGDRMRFDSETGYLENLATHRSYTVDPYPAFIEHIIACGGLVAYTRERLAESEIASAPHQ